MPLLRNGHWANDNPWVHVADEQDLPDNAEDHVYALCSLQRYQTLEAAGTNSVSGIWLSPEDDVLQLSEYLQRLQVIAIDFPTYTDGRGYTQARILRTQLHYSGELRAVGDIRPDQLLFMVRAGLDAFEFQQAPDAELINQILTRYRINYQPSYALPLAG